MTFFAMGAGGLFSGFLRNADSARDRQSEAFCPKGPLARKQSRFKTLTGQAPVVIAHRGDSGHWPEHTLEAYKSAIAKGADFIEPDLVVTKDGFLIARHEPMLAAVQLDPQGAILRDASGNPILSDTDTSTDVFRRPEFAGRLTVKNVDGTLRGGWFAEDFTLAEIKQLNAVERLPEIRGTRHDSDGLKVPTFVQIINLAKKVERITGRKIGIYPEIKHPTYFLSEGRLADGITPIGSDTTLMVVKTLKREGFTDPARVVIQSMEVRNLQRLDSVLMPAAGIDVPLVQLIRDSGKPFDFTLSGDPRVYSDMTSPAELAKIKNYADGIGPSKLLVLPMEIVDADGDSNPDDLNTDGEISDADRVVGLPTSLVKDAHSAGLFVHPYTLRDDPYYLASSYGGDALKEYQVLIELGVDGFFTDFPETGNAVLASHSCAGLGVANARGGTLRGNRAKELPGGRDGHDVLVGVHGADRYLFSGEAGFFNAANQCVHTITHFKLRQHDRITVDRVLFDLASMAGSGVCLSSEFALDSGDIAALAWCCATSVYSASSHHLLASWNGIQKDG